MSAKYDNSINPVTFFAVIKLDSTDKLAILVDYIAPEPWLEIKDIEVITPALWLPRSHIVSYELVLESNTVWEFTITKWLAGIKEIEGWNKEEGVEGRRDVYDSEDDGYNSVNDISPFDDDIPF